MAAPPAQLIKVSKHPVTTLLRSMLHPPAGMPASTAPAPRQTASRRSWLLPRCAAGTAASSLLLGRLPLLLGCLALAAACHRARALRRHQPPLAWEGLLPLGGWAAAAAAAGAGAGAALVGADRALQMVVALSVTAASLAGEGGGRWEAGKRTVRRLGWRADDERAWGSATEWLRSISGYGRALDQQSLPPALARGGGS